MRARGPIGRRRKLSVAQLDQLAQALLQGATAHGFAGNLWTLDRVTEVIWRQTGVRHHPVQVGRILKGRLGWSLQRPRRQAAERDQAAVDQWLTVQWPRIKQRARRRRAWVVFLDESGSSLLPLSAGHGHHRASHRSWSTRTTGSAPPCARRSAHKSAAAAPGWRSTSALAATTPRP